jgi:outer membrane lipoprotein-sorting protein
MLNNGLTAIFLMLCILLPVGFSQQAAVFNCIEMSFESKKLANGKKTLATGKIYYEKSGRMVSHIFSPSEIIIINNEKGDLLIYNPKLNEVAQEFNYTYSTQTTALYFFLKDQNNQLGLKSLGFTLKNSKFDKDYLITTWLPPANYIKHFKEAELVFQNNIPVYLKFVGHNNKPLKKSYYYNFKKVFNKQFPLAVTDIFYAENGDSSVEKTSYSQIKLNNEVNAGMLNFQIPLNAKNVK